MNKFKVMHAFKYIRVQIAAYYFLASLFLVALMGMVL